MSKNRIGFILTGVFIAVFILIIFYIKFYKGVDFVDQPGSVRERMLRHPGMKFFDEGAYQKIKNMPLEKACAQENSSHQLMCSEGYHFVDRSKAMNAFFKLEENQQRILEVSVADIAEALGVGIALSHLRKSPLDIKLKGDSKLMKYVYDGWGQREAIFRAFYSLDSICTYEDEYQKYCLYGVGRGLFFLDMPMKSLKTADSSTKRGYRFARIFGGGLEPLDPEDPIEKLAAQLLERPQSDWISTVKCGDKIPDHAADCQF